MEKMIVDSERALLLDFAPHDYFKVIVTSNDSGRVHVVHYAVRTDNVSAFMNSVYDSYDNDAVIQFNGIFQQMDSRFCFEMV